MTVTESGASKRPSSPNLSYVSLQGTTGDVAEERGSSEESQLQSGNNNNVQRSGDDGEGGALILPDDRTANFVSISNLISTGELTPLQNKKRDSSSIKDTDNINAISNRASFEPPDGGLRAWSVMIASFLINGILFGIINCYSLVFIKLEDKLKEMNETDTASKASLVGSLTIGTTFLLSPIAGILTDIIGIQITTFVGGAIASSGMILSCIFYYKIEVLYFTYGIMYGLGASLAYTPSLVILGHYFKRYIGLANGVVTAGSSIFTLILSQVMKLLISKVHLQGLFAFLAALTAVVMGCALLFKPVIQPPTVAPIDRAHHRSNLRVKLKQVVNVSVWKRKRYVVWASIIPLALFGYFVPYVHIGKFVQMEFTEMDVSEPIMCIGITSGIGRLIFGYIADKPGVNRILLQQISFFSIGLLTMLLPVVTSVLVLRLIILGMGLFDGCFISLLGPIAFDMCGSKDATQAIGFLLGMCAIPLISGPPIAGKLFDWKSNYNLAFYLAGIPPIIGSVAMFIIWFIKDDKNSIDRPADTETLNQPDRTPAQCAWQNEGKELQDMSKNGVAAKSP